MGVSEEITRATCQQIACFAGNYQRATQRLGIASRQISWLRHYTAGRLFRIGRMEYMLRPFSGAVQVYRNVNTGAIIALAADGTRYNTAGYVDGTAGNTDPNGWVATLTTTSDYITGFPVSPKGYAINQPLQLSTSEWQCVLTKGDTALEMHIPAGGGMTLAKCAESFRQAVPFFQQYFPAEPFQAIVCSSWIFNTQLEEIELSSDQLVAFQRELYLFPVRSTGQDGLWFIFLQDNFDLNTAPRKTSLQRAVINYLEAGHTWRGGGMFFLIEHLPQFGTQYYRNNDLTLQSLSTE